MATDLVLRCACGSLRGALRGVSPSRGNRVVCYCRDCQAFAHFLGRADGILDAHGGTDIFQTSPARLEITAGREHLACMRLTPRGMLRWHAGCCRTPIGNTLTTPNAPFVGMILVGVEGAQALGPIRARVHTGSARGDRAALATSVTGTISAVALFGRLVLQARMRGDHRRSPFFDPATGAPVVTPQVLSAERLAEVRL